MYAKSFVNTLSTLDLDDTLPAAPESPAGIANVVLVNGHPLLVDGGLEGINNAVA